MKTLVLDSWPLMEWILGKEPAATTMEMLLEAAEKSDLRLLMSAINVGEVYYFLRKHRGEQLAEAWREAVGTLPVTIEIPSEQDIWAAAIIKSQFPISYADAFAAALAQKHDAPLLTGDPEFKSVAGLKIEWLVR